MHEAPVKSRSMRQKRIISALLVNGILAMIVFFWTLPSLGLLVTSFRNKAVVNTSGCWTALGQPSELTAFNYQIVMAGKSYEYVDASGTKITERGESLVGAFLNSLAVTVPSFVIPILIAAFAAYGFAWLNFPGRKMMFVAIAALLVVPLQIALIPILRDYQAIKLNGTFLGIWLAHTGFGLPLVIYLLFNYTSTIPRSIMESAFINGATHFETFVKLIPLLILALASFAIFQFIWVWNDLLVALVFLSGTGQDNQVVTQRPLNMIGTRGQDWHLLTAGTFVTMILPLVVFFSPQ